MRKLTILAGAAAAILSLGAMCTADAEAFIPAAAATTQMTNGHRTTPIGDAFAAKRRPRLPIQYSTTNDRHARRNSDARGETSTPYSVPSRVSASHIDQWNGVPRTEGGSDNNRVPSRVATRNVRTQANHTSKDWHSSNDRTRRRDSSRHRG